MNKLFAAAGLCCALAGFSAGTASAREMTEEPRIRLRTLDKTTARTMTFEAAVGSTLKFGSLYIKVQSCQKSSPVDQPEAAAFLQIWEEVPDPKKSKNEENNSEWVFSGWMFASSPGLSAMDHPIYDVWVLECLGAEGEQTATAQGDGDGVTTDAAQPQEPKNFDSLLKGLTGHDSESAPADGENGETPAENSPDKAAGDQANTDPDGELQTPVAPDIGEENIPEPTPVDVEIIDDETQGLPPSGDE